MLDKLLQKALVLNQHLERYRPLALAEERELTAAAEQLVHTLETALKNAHAPSLAKARGAAVQVEAFERLIRPFFQKMLPPLATLQNQFSSSQSWFAYRAKAHGTKEIFTLGKLYRLIQNEPVDELMLVSQMKDTKEKNKYSARVTISFVFDGLRLNGYYMIESPTAEGLRVKIDLEDEWYSYDEERLAKLVGQVSKEIRTIVWENTY